ncbi:nucleotide exchange factor GrpE [Nakamurella leprariae]|uniref:nucleotide exchange factor GrpE n=1 Tax=Nakamurella leprariae TaxID=2803911 RepID=UPI002E2BB324|nr:nucleotide exchange factor GrpE [Nakamurella leprariae]
MVIRDKRRIDPESGTLRGSGAEPGADQAHAGPGAGSPFPAGSPGQVPGDPNQAAQALHAELADPVAAVELEQARQEAAERTADLQRVTAEYANYRRRVDRDREQVVTAAKGSVIADLLPVLDDLDRAAAHGDLTGSFKAVADKLQGVLSKLGLEPVGAQGDVFDPAQHEAVQFETSAEVTEPTVSAVFRHGYRLGDRLVRPAVVVVTGPEHESPAAGETPAG